MCVDPRLENDFPVLSATIRVGLLASRREGNLQCGRHDGSLLESEVVGIHGGRRFDRSQPDQWTDGRTLRESFLDPPSKLGDIVKIVGRMIFGTNEVHHLMVFHHQRGTVQVE